MKNIARFYNVINVILLSMMLVSCDCCDDKITDMKTEVKKIMDLGGGGNFIIVNTESKDTLRVEGKGISVSVGNPTYEILDAHYGDRIKIMFEQNEKYKDYVFNTTYTLPNDEVVENQPEFEYVVGDNLNGSYNIEMSASSIGETKNNTWFITAGNTFTLKVVQ